MFKSYVVLYVALGPSLDLDLFGFSKCIRAISRKLSCPALCIVVVF